MRTTGQEFPNVSVAGLALLNALLTYDPAKRLSARAALRHGYFREQPLPKAPAHMPTFPSAHDSAAPGEARQQGWRSRRCPACRSCSCFVAPCKHANLARLYEAWLSWRLPHACSAPCQRLGIALRHPCAGLCGLTKPFLRPSCFWDHICMHACARVAMERAEDLSRHKGLGEPGGRVAQQEVDARFGDAFGAGQQHKRSRLLGPQ